MSTNGWAGMQGIVTGTYSAVSLCISPVKDYFEYITMNQSKLPL